MPTIHQYRKTRLISLSGLTFLGSMVLGGWAIADSQSNESAPIAQPMPPAPASGGVVQRRSDEWSSLLNVRLDGATEYELTEIFGKVVNTVPGVIETKIYNTRIAPNNPQASHVLWRARTEPDLGVFRLQARITEMLRRLVEANGELTLEGNTYHLNAAEVGWLKRVRAASAISREVQFIVDWEESRDWKRRQVAVADAQSMPVIVEQVTLGADAFFDHDQADLKPAGVEGLDSLIRDLLAARRIARIEIVGHTDSAGAEAYNLRLSKQRAVTVRDYLIRRNIDPNLIATQGAGENQPIADNATPEGRAHNRRVEVTLKAERESGQTPSIPATATPSPSLPYPTDENPKPAR